MVNRLWLGSVTWLTRVWTRQWHWTCKLTWQKRDTPTKQQHCWIPILSTIIGSVVLQGSNVNSMQNANRNLNHLCLVCCWLGLSKGSVSPLVNKVIKVGALKYIHFAQISSRVHCLNSWLSLNGTLINVIIGRYKMTLVILCVVATSGQQYYWTI